MQSPFKFALAGLVLGASVLLVPGQARADYDTPVTLPPVVPIPPTWEPGPVFHESNVVLMSLPNPGQIYLTPRGFVRIDGLPGGTPPDGGVKTVNLSAGVGTVVLPNGNDNRLVIEQFFGFTTPPVNGISFVGGIVDDTDGTADLVTGNLTVTFDDATAFTFTGVPASGLSFFGFQKLTGPDIKSITLSSSTGKPAIGSFGIGTVPEPTTLSLLVGAGVLALRRRS